MASFPTEYIKGARKYIPAATTQHGQCLFWGKTENNGNCIQGVTELTECVRCQDKWLRDVQQQIRNGTLDADTHAFLHGLATTCAGSSIAGQSTCVQGCQAMHGECDVCKRERASKNLVAHGPDDLRLRSPNFIAARAIFANNDVKYDCNKRRSRIWMQWHGCLVL